MTNESNSGNKDAVKRDQIQGRKAAEGCYREESTNSSLPLHLTSLFLKKAELIPASLFPSTKENHRKENL
jgi:hypothetical protein